MITLLSSSTDGLTTSLDASLEKADLERLARPADLSLLGMALQGAVAQRFLHDAEGNLQISPSTLNEAKERTWIELLEHAACDQCKREEQTGCKVGKCDSAPRCWCSKAFEAEPNQRGCPKSYKGCDELEDMPRLTTLTDDDGDRVNDDLQPSEFAELADGIELRKSADDLEEELEADLKAEHEAKDYVEHTAPEPAEVEVEYLMSVAKEKGIKTCDRNECMRMHKRNGGVFEEASIEMCAAQLMADAGGDGKLIYATAACRQTNGSPNALARKKFLIPQIKAKGETSTRDAERAYDALFGAIFSKGRWGAGRAPGMNKNDGGDGSASIAFAGEGSSGDIAEALEAVKGKTSDPEDKQHQGALKVCTGNPDAAQFGSKAGDGGGHGALAPGDKATIIEFHNKVRREHCASELMWDDDMAATAQAYANTCPCGKSPTTSRPGSSESIAWSKQGLLANSSELVQFWYDESSDYDSYEDGGSSPGSKGFFHFTQMVWKGTRAIGCGYRYGCPTPEHGLGGHIWVCHYRPGGNTGRTKELRRQARLRNVKEPVCGPAAKLAASKAVSMLLPADPSLDAAPATTLALQPERLTGEAQRVAAVRERLAALAAGANASNVSVTGPSSWTRDGTRSNDGDQSSGHT